MEITLGMGGRVFWAYVWRSIVWGMIFGIVIGVVTGVAAFLLPSAQSVLKWVPMLLTIPVGIKVMSIVFDRRYKRYSVRLVDAQTGAELPRRFWNGLPLWWSFFWRGTLINSVFIALAVVLLGGTRKSENQPAFPPQASYAQCQIELARYRENVNKPEGAVIAQLATQQFNALRCREVMAAPAPQQTPVHKPLSALVWVFIALGAVMGILAQIKIFQILLRKKYRHFHVQVTSRES